MICLLYEADQVTCSSYLSTETLLALFTVFCVYWLVFGLFKIVLRLMGFN